MDWKKLLHKLLFPGAPVVLLSIPVGFGLLAYTFLVAGEESPIATPISRMVGGKPYWFEKLTM